MKNFKKIIIKKKEEIKIKKYKLIIFIIKKIFYYNFKNKITIKKCHYRQLINRNHLNHSNIIY